MSQPVAHFTSVTVFSGSRVAADGTSGDAEIIGAVSEHGVTLGGIAGVTKDLTNGGAVAAITVIP